MCGYVPGLTGPADADALADDPDAPRDDTGALVDDRDARPAELRTSTRTERTVEAPELGAHVLLAIDTSLGTSVALGGAGRVVEVVSDDQRGHAEVIGGALQRVFALSGLRPADVTGVVVGIGPGPFTGLRVGIAAAHAFAAGRGVPVHPLHGHDAVAHVVHEAAQRAHAAVGAVRVVQDARRRELFVTDYAGVDWLGGPLASTAPHLVPRAEFVDGPHDVWPDRVPTASLVRLAARRLSAGQPFAEDRAVYLRAPDVKPSAGPKRVTP